MWIPDIKLNDAIYFVSEIALKQSKEKLFSLWSDVGIQITIHVLLLSQIPTFRMQLAPQCGTCCSCFMLILPPCVSLFSMSCAFILICFLGLVFVHIVLPCSLFCPKLVFVFMFYIYIVVIFTAISVILRLYCTI